PPDHTQVSAPPVGFETVNSVAVVTSDAESAGAVSVGSSGTATVTLPPVDVMTQAARSMLTPEPNRYVAFGSTGMVTVRSVAAVLSSCTAIARLGPTWTAATVEVTGTGLSTDSSTVSVSNASPRSIGPGR